MTLTKAIHESLQLPKFYSLIGEEKRIKHNLLYEKLILGAAVLLLLLPLTQKKLFFG
jgi:hypothetical protein